MKASATFSPVKWEEKVFEQPSPNTKLTKVSAEFAYTGQLEGQGLVEYVMFYSTYDDRDLHKATAEYVGLVRFTGTLNGKTGTVVLEDRGTFEARAATSRLRVLRARGPVA